MACQIPEKLWGASWVQLRPHPDRHSPTTFRMFYQQLSVLLRVLLFVF
jgi:hypothetical protein